MKRIFITLLFIFIMSIPINTKAIAISASNSNNLKVYVFESDNCKNCTKANNWLTDSFKNNNEIDIEVINDQKLLSKVKDKLKIKKDKTPLIIIGSNYFTGFDNKIKDNVIDTVKSIQNTEKYCNIVLKIKNDEDIKDCLSQSIYKQNNWLKPTIIVSSIVLVIGIIIVILKQKGLLKSDNLKSKKTVEKK